MLLRILRIRDEKRGNDLLDCVFSPVYASGSFVKFSFVLSSQADLKVS